jgi:hypothetical protein
MLYLFVTALTQRILLGLSVDLYCCCNHLRARSCRLCQIHAERPANPCRAGYCIPIRPLLLLLLLLLIPLIPLLRLRLRLRLLLLLLLLVVILIAPAPPAADPKGDLDPTPKRSGSGTPAPHGSSSAPRMPSAAPVRRQSGATWREMAWLLLHPILFSVVLSSALGVEPTTQPVRPRRQRDRQAAKPAGFCRTGSDARLTEGLAKPRYLSRAEPRVGAAVVSCRVVHPSDLPNRELRRLPLQWPTNDMERLRGRRVPSPSVRQVVRLSSAAALRRCVGVRRRSVDRSVGRTIDRGLVPPRTHRVERRRTAFDARDTLWSRASKRAPALPNKSASTRSVRLPIDSSARAVRLLVRLAFRSGVIRADLNVPSLLTADCRPRVNAQRFARREAGVAVAGDCPHPPTDTEVPDRIDRQSCRPSIFFPGGAWPPPTLSERSRAPPDGRKRDGR